MWPTTYTIRKKKILKSTFLIFWWLLRPRDYQNLFRHVGKNPHANYELIWFRESPVFDIFTSGVRGVSPEVWTFSGPTLKRLKWFVEAAFEPRDYQNIDLHVMEHHLDQLLYGFVHCESSFDHFIEKQTWRVLKSFSRHSLTRLSIGTEHRSDFFFN